MKVDRLNDGTSAAPYLRRDINVGNLANLPRASAGWCASHEAQLALLKATGHVAVQSWDGWDATVAVGLAVTGMGRVTEPAQADSLARHHKQAGVEATTLHVGTGFESDAEIDRLVGAVLEASARHGYPLFIETHRATITQDIRRTLDMIGRFPEVRFTADLSHWYTGQEMTYGGEFMQRVAFLDPVFERVRCMHGRIGNSGAMQTSLDRPGPYLAHYQLMWQRCFAGFLAGAKPGDYLSFNAELLPDCIGTGADAFWLCYADRRPDAISQPMEGEASDRFADAAILWRMASAAFAAAASALTP